MSGIRSLTRMWHSKADRSGPRRRRARAVCRILVALALTAVASPAKEEPVEVGEVRFARTCSPSGGDLRLIGAGVLRWKVIFRAYAAAFYLSADTVAEDWSQDTPKCLTIHYFWDIPREKLGPAGEAVLERMYPAEQLVAVRDHLNAIAAAYVDIQAGDRYQLVYRPGRGTTLLHNGNPLATLLGHRFAHMYFSIWLGSDPVDEGLRARLLGKR